MKEFTVPDITVPVPDDRTADFYQFFGHWLAGNLEISTTISEGSGGASEAFRDTRARWTGSADDVDDAVRLWSKLTGARGMFELLMEDPGKRYTSREIATALDIANGSNGVAGRLAHPGRYCRKMNRYLPIRWKDCEDGPSVYWMEPEVAELFAKARAQNGN